MSLPNGALLIRKYSPVDKRLPKVNNKDLRTISMDVALSSLFITLILCFNTNIYIKYL